MVQMPIDYGKNIYHFTRIETALLYILPSHNLKLTSLLESNDPKENRTFGFWSILSEVDMSKHQTIKHAFQVFLHKNCKHLCFSQDYKKNRFFVPGFRHPTMWAHYADNSKGVCLVINREKFLLENSKLINSKIKYKSILDFPSIDWRQWEKGENSYLEKFVNKNANKLFFQKHYHWSNEHELKFIEIGQIEYCSIQNSLVGVYLGPDFDSKLNNLILELMKPYNGQIERLIIEDGEFFASPILSTNDEF